MSDPSLPLPWRLLGRSGSERLRHWYQLKLRNDRSVKDIACTQGDRWQPPDTSVVTTRSGDSELNGLVCVTVTLRTRHRLPDEQGQMPVTTGGQPVRKMESSA